MGRPPSKPSREKLLATLKDLEELERRRKYRALEFFKPYPRQKEFLDLGADKRERLLMAANQVGKTETGAFEVACHMTGLYPEDWKGRVWKRPTRGWIAGETSAVVRDVQQRKLCGEPGVEEAFGSGMIPKALFVDKPSLAAGIRDAYDTIMVRHASGGVSVAKFKSYEQGRTKFQADTLDWFWGDEEPDEDIYSEMLTRITATKGMGFITFTPLKGMSEVVIRFLNEASPDRGVVIMTIEDAEHIPPEERARIVAGYPAHEREARAKGIPMLGSGRVFQIAEEQIACEAFPIPGYWPLLWGIDFGITHPFAAVLCAWDREADCIYVTHTLRMKDTQPIHHAAAMKPFGKDIPVAWPHDGARRDPGSGVALAKLYKAQGLHMLAKHATWPDGSMSTEAAIQDMTQRMQTGRFKVFNTCRDFFEEFRMYHRKDGLLVKERDDILSAAMKVVMMRRYARAYGTSDARGWTARPKVQIAQGVESDHWGI